MQPKVAASKNTNVFGRISNYLSYKTSYFQFESVTILKTSVIKYFRKDFIQCHVFLVTVTSGSSFLVMSRWRWFKSANSMHSSNKVLHISTDQLHLSLAPAVLLFFEHLYGYVVSVKFLTFQFMHQHYFLFTIVMRV
jgi:hypothetical protein